MEDTRKPGTELAAVDGEMTMAELLQAVSRVSNTRELLILGYLQGANAILAAVKDRQRPSA